LECTVSLLTAFESGLGWDAWDIGTHGLIIDFDDPVSGHGRSATYLPEVAKEQGWTKQECVDSLVQKAGYNGRVTAELREALKLTRYQSSKHSMTHEDYVAWKSSN